MTIDQPLCDTAALIGLGFNGPAPCGALMLPYKFGSGRGSGCGSAPCGSIGSPVADRSASLSNAYSSHSACPRRHHFLAFFPLLLVLYPSRLLRRAAPRRASPRTAVKRDLASRCCVSRPTCASGFRHPCGRVALNCGFALSREARESAMELDFRCPSADINTVYLSSFLGKGDVAGHRCDCSCQVQHVWANLYRCTTSGSSHVCDQNCNQRIIYDNHSTLCRVSGRVFPLTASEQEAIRGVRRKRDAESSDSSPLKRCRDMLKSAASFEAPFRQRALPVPTFMDIN